ncbi:MAG: hypothetical protein EHM64_09630 [Ignavibacteriae bacterium]|nr:MAG: hypothetical protein EHM64_09630 [Ignavibacteriota bacterium]
MSKDFDCTLLQSLGWSISTIIYEDGSSMVYWFLLAGSDAEKLKTKFVNFYSEHKFPPGIALWKWKKTCWICSPVKFKDEILASFVQYGIIEFSSAPSPSDIEFLYGDENALKSLSQSS